MKWLRRKPAPAAPVIVPPKPRLISAGLVEFAEGRFVVVERTWTGTGDFVTLQDEGSWVRQHTVKL